MFVDASSFNQPLNKWNVSNVTHMREMFDEGIEDALRYARAALAAREGDGVSSVCEAVAAAKLRTA